MIRLIILSALLVLTLHIFANTPKKKQAGWQQKVSYSIEADIDTTGFIRAEINFTYYNFSPDTLAEIWIHLWPNAFSSENSSFAKELIDRNKIGFHFATQNESGKIDSLSFSSHNQILSYTIRPENIDIASIKLLKPLFPGDSIHINTPFRVKIPSFYYKWGKSKNLISLSHWFPQPAVYDANGWNLNAYSETNNYAGETGNFKVKITIPYNMAVAGTGILKTQKELNHYQCAQKKGKTLLNFKIPPSDVKTKTLYFEQNDISDFALVASSEFYINTDTCVLSNGNVVGLYFYSLLKLHNTDNLKSSFKKYSTLFGIKNYSSYSLVITDKLDASYPLLLMCSDSSAIHNPHIGSILLSKTSATLSGLNNDCDQGLKLFLNTYIIDANKLISLNNYYSSFYFTSFTQISEYTPLHFQSTYFQAKYALMFYNLYQLLGDKLFFDCLEEYFRKWNTKHPLSEDIKNIFEEKAQIELSWLFDDWVYSLNKQDLSVNPSRIKNKPNSYILTVNGHATIFPLIIKDQNGNILVDTALKAFSGEKEIMFKDLTSEKITISINPKFLIPDCNTRNNNLKTHGGKRRFNLPRVYFINPEPFHQKNNLFILPIIGWNHNAKIMAGGLISNGTNSLKPIEFSIIPLYSFKHENTNGYFAFSYKKHTDKMGGAVKEIGLNTMKMNSYSQGNSITIFKINPFVEFDLPVKGKTTNKHQKVSTLRLEYNLVESDAASYIIYNKFIDTTYRLFYDASNHAQHLRISYTYENKQPISPVLFVGLLENGWNRDPNPNNKNQSYMKASAKLRFSHIFKALAVSGKQKKAIRGRLFAGYFIKQTENLSGRNYFTMMGVNNNYDYYIEESLLARGMSQVSELTMNQIADKDGGMRNTAPAAIGLSNNWLFSGNIETDLPGILPFRLFADIGFSGMATTVQIHYTAGVSLPIFDQFFEIYFPFVFSKQIQDYYKFNNSSFGEKICFKLRLDYAQLRKAYESRINKSYRIPSSAKL